MVTVIGAMGGLFAAAYVLLAGYVYADASRRGMPAIAWTALTVLVPNAIGFVLYFLLRKPIVHPLSQLRMRSCARCCLLFQMRPIAIEC